MKKSWIFIAGCCFLSVISICYTTMVIGSYTISTLNARINTLLSLNSELKKEIFNLKEQINKLDIKQEAGKISFKARVTGYEVKPGQKGALGKPVISGRTAAVSRNCKHLLGHKIYVDQLGVFEVTDLTAEWVGNTYNEVCTIDIARPSREQAQKVGNELRQVNKLPISF